MMIRESESTTISAGACAATLHIPEEPRLEPDLYRTLMVEPGVKIALGDIDPGDCDIRGSYERTTAIIRSYMQKIDQLQYLMYAEKRHSLLIVLQGLDAAGKDGVVRNILTSMNPVGCRVTAFKQPTAAELAHDFLWRVHPHAPAKGEVTIFNRSHYEDVLVARVHQLAPASMWAKRYGKLGLNTMASQSSGTATPSCIS